MWVATDSPWAALWIALKKGPTLNEIYLETRRWSFLLTDDMIPGHELYEKQSRRLGLNWWISRSGLRITRSVFLLLLAKWLLFKIPTGQLWLVAK